MELHLGQALIHLVDLVIIHLVEIMERLLGQVIILQEVLQLVLHKCLLIIMEVLENIIILLEIILTMKVVIRAFH